MTLSIGVDLHKSQFTTCWRMKGRKTKECAYPFDDKGLGSFLKDIKARRDKGAKVQVAVESTGNTRYFKNLLEKHSVKVRLIDPRKFKVVCESAKKTDRHDARLIAEFLEKDFIPEARLCDEKSQEVRRLVSARQALVRTGTKLKNQLHGMLLDQGVLKKKGAFNSKKGLETALSELDETGRTIAKPITEAILYLADKADELEAQIVKLTEDHPTTQRVLSIPGAGPLTAAIVRAYLDDPKLFADENHFAAFAGLVPRVESSDKKIHIGRITKQGPKELRTALVQIVIGMVRNKAQRNNALMIQYRRLKAKKGSGRALVAVARKLATIIWHLVTRGEDFDPTKLGPRNKPENAKTYKLKAAS